MSTLLLVVIAVLAHGTLSQNIDDILGEVFTKAPGTDDGGESPDAPDIAGHTDNAAGDDCECVPYWLCKNNSIITDGVGLIDIRLRGVCQDYMDVCCNKPDVLDRTPSNPDQPNQPGPPDYWTTTPRPRTGCGQRNPEGVGFRITGHSDGEAQFAEFPWMVAVLREEVVDGSELPLNVYQCGGSLINLQVVLTAAHCVIGKHPQDLKVRAGEWDTQTKNELFPHQDRAVGQIIVHENYYAGALYNDVALLILDTPVDPAENVDVVCLPHQNAKLDRSRCFASGWGKDVFGKEGRYQVILKKVELPIVPNPQCQTALRKTRLGPYFNLHKSFICAGGEASKDTCKGDGGSPLVCPFKNDPHHYQQAGIVAWGIGCGEDQTPGVYVNVALFRDWIDRKMTDNYLDPLSYTRS